MAEVTHTDKGNGVQMSFFSFSATLPPKHLLMISLIWS